MEIFNTIERIVWLFTTTIAITLVVFVGYAVKHYLKEEKDEPTR